MGFEGTLFNLGHWQVGTLVRPLIAWPLQPSKSMPPKRVIHQLLKGNSSTSQITRIIFGLNVRFSSSFWQRTLSNNLLVWLTIPSAPSLRAHGSQLCTLFAMRESVLLYAELWTEGTPPWNSDLIKDRIALEKTVPPLAQFRWKVVVPTDILEPNLLHKDFGTHNKRSELVCWVKHLGNLGKDLAFRGGNLVGRRKIHWTSLSNVLREFWLCFLCRSRGSLWLQDDRFGYELRFICGRRSIFLMESPRNLEHFVAREQWVERPLRSQLSRKDTHVIANDVA